MKIAVEGCMHGELDKVYATIKRLEEAENTKIDLLLCCGDFQAVRNEEDLKSLNVPPKYRHMNSFWKYYSGQVTAPYPTIFIGGNHEASNYLWELYYGGWAAPNIYFLGFAGVIKFGNIRIGGLSGIYKSKDYYLGHYERPPYDDNSIRSVYHVRQYDVLKLMQIKEPIDIFLSHDWPLGITEYGNWEKLVQQKPFFRDEVRLRTLGSKPAAELLDKLKPPYWFSAHLHCRFPAIIQHGENGPITKFLALDKCLPGRRFLQIFEIKSDPGPPEIQYDEEWLAITRKFNRIFPLSREHFHFRSDHFESQDFRNWVRSQLNARGAKPFEFLQTMPSFDPNKPSSALPSGHCRNLQTVSFLKFLELPYLLDIKDEPSTPKKITEFSCPLGHNSSNMPPRRNMSKPTREEIQRELRRLQQRIAKIEEMTQEEVTFDRDLEIRRGERDKDLNPFQLANFSVEEDRPRLFEIQYQRRLKGGYLHSSHKETFREEMSFGGHQDQGRFV